MAAAPSVYAKANLVRVQGVAARVLDLWGLSKLGAEGASGTECGSAERTSRGLCTPQWTTPSGSYQRRAKSNLVSCQVDEDLLQKWTLLLWQHAPGDALRP